MLGKIIGIEGNTLLIDLQIELSKFQNIANLYVAVEEPGKIFVAEIVEIRGNTAYANLVGEIKNGNFVFGVIRKPSFSATVKLVSKEKISHIIGVPAYEDNKDLMIGTSAVYDDIPIGVKINDFFANHFAIFGATGSGKSSSVARIFQNLFAKKEAIPYKASFFMFDAYGEYHSAFKDIGDANSLINFKAYTTNLRFADTEILKIPLWLLDTDDIAILLGADKHAQIPIIEKALKLVTIFGREESLVLKHKNDIIARAILDILSSGRPPGQIRDQVFSVLSYYNTSELNLETEVFQPGYTRPVKQLLLIDATGKIREMELLMTFLEKFLADDLELNFPDGSYRYTLENLKDAFDFALIAEGALKSDRVYDDANILKVRLHSLVSSEQKTYFDYPEYISGEDYIKELLTAPNGKKAQIINFNINYVDDRLAKVITKLYSKILFDFNKKTDKRGALPFNIILEEAHRYVQNDIDVDLLGYNIFERIAKEGRKYGISLGLITQRPSEMSATALSQCSNFLIFRMLHPTDVEYIKEMVPNITNETITKLKILQPGTCVAFGLGFKVPVITKLKMPSPAPSSSSSDLSSIWFVSNK